MTRRRDEFKRYQLSSCPGRDGGSVPNTRSPRDISITAGTRTESGSFPSNPRHHAKLGANRARFTKNLVYQRGSALRSIKQAKFSMEASQSSQSAVSAMPLSPASFHPGSLCSYWNELSMSKLEIRTWNSFNSFPSSVLSISRPNWIDTAREWSKRLSTIREQGRPSSRMDIIRDYRK